MPKYIVFDVETPNRYNNRMSAIGISIVENGKIVKSFFSYVDPEQSFDWFNTKLTGIDARTVAGAPTFPELWKKIEPILSSGVLVAHNASFDMGVLKKCLKDYNIQWKSAVPYCCTVQIGRRVLPEISHKLNNVCDHYGICLGAIHIRLGHQREGHTVVQAAELFYLLVAAGLLAAELVAGEAEHHQALVLILLI